MNQKDLLNEEESYVFQVILIEAYDPLCQVLFHNQDIYHMVMRIVIISIM